MLIILSGLPGAGKTTIARALAKEIAAVHIRIDTIEQALRDAGFAGEMNDAGYRIAYAVAEDNLRLGRIVIADSVNPLQITRNAWRAVASRAGAQWRDIEMICSNKHEHRRRVEQRQPEIPGHRLPTWVEVEDREYHAWDRDHVVIDSARTKPKDGIAQILAALAPASGAILVPLLNEGVDVWRPVEAAVQPDGTYMIVGEVPDGEEWEFKTGSVVLCEWRNFSNGQVGLVATRAA